LKFFGDARKAAVNRGDWNWRLPQTSGSVGQVLRIEIERDDLTPGVYETCDRFAVAAATDSAVHRHIPWLWVQNSQRFRKQNWDMAMFIRHLFVAHYRKNRAPSTLPFMSMRLIKNYRSVSTPFIAIALPLLPVTVSACTGVRFVIDAVPATDKLTETVVMSDGGPTLGKIGESKIAMISVTGLIADAERPGLIAAGENPVSRFVESLQKAKDDKAVKAVIVRVNSPGGTVTASDVMFREIQHFKQETHKPVVILMGDVAASGGYYVSCAGDEIIAHPTTVTGSIGVLIQTVNVSEGLNRIGVRAEAITSGPNKKMGTPFEPMPREHRELLQRLVDEFYHNFKSIVVASRPALSPNDLEWITDGRVITGKRAAEVGLVDKLGDLREAFQAAKSRANLRTAKLVKYHRQLEYVGSPYAATPLPGASQINFVQLNLANDPLREQPGFYYLWDPAMW
jgi:protease-4